jgi:hypothetical protein
LDVFRAFGGNVDTLRSEYSKLMENMKESQTKYTKFGLGRPGALIRVGKKIYIIVPYGSRMIAGGQLLCQEAFFVGSSSDGGKTWRFIDGIGVTEQNIGKVIPNYSGGELPLRSETTGVGCAVPP